MTEHTLEQRNQAQELPSADFALQLQDYIEAFENLSETTLLTQLALLFDTNVVFKDPFNCVTGKAETLHIFQHMFATLEQPQFKVSHRALDGHVGFINWVFQFRLQPNKPVTAIEGMSRVRFNQQGLVTEHVDFWDAGAEVYAKVPLLGWGIRQVAKRLSAQ
ncbi:MAG: nuclear transport factor 2 family protein [Thiomicrorhabdus chilensis]|uniref:nuclear transport factor 2 family protein n=1 Tax=Thiomicrorhabdus chilensis TaxID=63656 RepID=UPI00299E8165|nr:nuclear transport factor 2 family protein [Thiomicrorhabdus chilensis]MDX1347897.1 nuclear transport factor 2 family protein [Thiomicrorhabdus chilensis]